jgi:hypothetical protein
MSKPKYAKGAFVMVGGVSPSKCEVVQVFENASGPGQHRYTVQNVTSGRINTHDETALEATSAPPNDKTLKGQHSRAMAELRGEHEETARALGQMTDRVSQLEAQVTAADAAHKDEQVAHAETKEALEKALADKSTPEHPNIQEMTKAVVAHLGERHNLLLKAGEIVQLGDEMRKAATLPEGALPIPAMAPDFTDDLRGFAQGLVDHGVVMKDKLPDLLHELEEHTGFVLTDKSAEGESDAFEDAGSAEVR